MRIEELCSRFDDDTDGQIVAVRSSSEGLSVQLQIDSWDEEGSQKAFEIHASQVKESRVCPGWIGRIEFCREHPLLWNYNFAWLDLYHTTAPTSRAELVGRLYEVHHKLFNGSRLLADYLNFYGLSDSHGLIASGPEPLISEYIRALQGVVRMNTANCHRIPNPAKALILGDSYVICSDVNVDDVEFNLQ